MKLSLAEGGCSRVGSREPRHIECSYGFSRMGELDFHGKRCHHPESRNASGRPRRKGGIRVFEDRAEASAEISSVMGEKGATDHFFFIPCWSTPVKLRSRATSAPSSLAKLGSPSRFSRPVPRPDPVDSCWMVNGARGLSAVRLLLSDLCLVSSSHR